MPSDTILGLTGQIDALHYMVHAKRSYTYSEVKSVAGNATYYILIVPAEDEEMHFTASVTSTIGAMTAQLYKNPTTTANGTEVTPQNHYAVASPPSPDGKMYHTPTVTGTSYGTLLESASLGGGTRPASRFGGTGSTRNEWIMEYPNTYLVKMTDTSASTNGVILNFSFYTHKEED